MLHFGKKTPEREEWWAVSDQTGEVFGPFDPGTVWFETPNWIGGSELLRLSRVADLILNEAHAGWERLQRALAFLQPNGVAVYRRFMESGVLPRTGTRTGSGGRAGCSGLSGGWRRDRLGWVACRRYLHDGTSMSGFSGGAGSTSSGRQRGRSGEGHGRGLVGGQGISSRGGRRGWLWECWRGSWGGCDSPIAGILGLYGDGCEIHLQETFCNSASWRRRQFRTRPWRSMVVAAALYIWMSERNDSKRRQNLAVAYGTSGRSHTNTDNGGGGSDGGARLGQGSQLDHAFNMALEISTASGGAYARGGSATRRGGTGGNGRVIQVYFDSKADDLQVTDGVQSQFRILRSVPIGQNTFL